MAPFQDVACPAQEGTSSNWNGRSAEESLSLRNGTETRNMHRRTPGKCQGDWFTSHPGLTVVLAFGVFVILPLVVTVPVLAGRSHGEIPDTPKSPYLAPCPEAWDDYNRVCYYFSLDWRSWDEAQDRCSELGASLAVLRDEEMNFAFCLSDNLDYWLGLHRRGERFQWVDGSSYNSSLEVLGNSECVYLADNVLRSEDCSTQLPYLCSKPQPHL